MGRGGFSRITILDFRLLLRLRLFFTLANNMKTRSVLSFLLLFCFTGISQSDIATHPPAKLRGDWCGLVKQGYNSWSIESYGGTSGLFDGGSKTYLFSTTAGVKFSIMAANPAYWTVEDKKRKRQVFYVLHKKLFYLLGQGSSHEEELLSKLEKAKKKLIDPDWHDPGDLDYLMQRIRSRKPMFKN